jgi:hypothetical protein
LSSHDLSWLQCTVAAGPADDGRSTSSATACVLAHAVRGVGARVAGFTLSGKLQLNTIPVVAHELANRAHLLP